MMMSRYILFLFLFIGATASYAQPRISFERTTFFCGEVKQGDRARFAFKFRNVGDSALKIFDVKTTENGLSEPNYNRADIVKWTTDSVFIYYDADFVKLGSVQHALTINSNDPIEPAKTIYFTFSVIKRLPKH